MESRDLPSLYRTADSISNRSQAEYFRISLAYLFCLFSGAMLAYATAFLPGSKWLAVASAVGFLASLGLSLLLYFQRPEASWYSARAVAESVKTRSWRWMMRADPYTDRESISIARKEFIQDLKAILDQNKEMANRIGGEDCSGEAITERMERIRAADFPERLSIYKEKRIQDQLGWYQRKTVWNGRRARQWFGISVALNSIAVIFLLVQIADSKLTLPVEVVAFLAGAALTWTQMKKFRELATSYGLTAHEITLIKGEAVNVRDERHFSEFVLNSENAFSREHTQWVARKE